MSKKELFESTFKEYFSSLCNYVNKHISDIDASRDIVQSTFLKVWNNWNSFSSADSQKQYLFRAVKNGMIDYLKKERRIDKNKIDFTAIQDEKVDELDSMILKSEIMKAIDQLKPKNRKIFLLNKIEGLTYAEISEFLNISQRTVEDNMARALKILRKQLENNKYIFGN